MGYLIGVYAAVRQEPDGGIWAAVRPYVASSTAARRSSDVLLITLDHPGAGMARDGGGDQREYDYHVFQESCAATICNNPVEADKLTEERVALPMGSVGWSFLSSTAGRQRPYP